MAITVGIDLGTTNSVMSHWHKGRTSTVTIDGMNTFPSVISYKNGNIIAGYQAKARVLMDPSNTIGSTKRDIGTDTKYHVGGRSITPVFIATEVLKAMKQKAEDQLKDKIEDAVITVPAYFTSEQREATLVAAKNAGLNVLRLVPEPTAAAIAYGLNENKNQTIMVYDLGGGTFDVSILKITGNKFDVIAVDGDARLGGDDFDAAIGKLLLKKVKEDTGVDLNLNKEREYMAARQKVREAAEKAKIELSEKEIVEIILPNLFEDYYLEYELSRKEYLKLIQPLLDKTIQKMKNVLKQARITADDIDRVILVGGSTKAPIIKELVKKEIREPYIAPNVDEVVSNGAAILAATLGAPDVSLGYDNLPDIVVKEKVVHSYGIDLLDEDDKLYYHIIVPKGSLLPVKEGTLAFTSKPYQKSVYMNIFRGESTTLSKNEKLGGLSLPIDNPEKGQTPVGAIFEIDENMIIKFRSVDLNRTSSQEELIDFAYENNGLLHLNKVDDLIRKNQVTYREVKVDVSK